MEDTNNAFRTDEINVTSALANGCDKSVSVCDYAGTRNKPSPASPMVSPR